MMKSTRPTKRFKRFGVLLAVPLLMICFTPVASATILQIQLGGVDLIYDGTDVMDAGGLAQPDPLTNATFILDGDTQGVVSTGVTMDLWIPGVLNIPVVGGQLTSDPDGSMYLDFGNMDFLQMTLDAATIAYIPLTSEIQFVFAGAVAGLDSQQLPFGLTILEPVSVSFSTRVSNWSSDDGIYVSSFTSAGTGEVQGIPEPATLGLLALGSLSLLRSRRRRSI